jgi:hypothetical protein
MSAASRASVTPRRPMTWSVEYNGGAPQSGVLRKSPGLEQFSDHYFH